MCSVCRCTPCLSGCPNAPDPPAAFGCHDCGEDICPGDEYARIGSEEYCKYCLDDYPHCVLIPLLGGEWKTVQDGEVIKCNGCDAILPVGEEYGIVDGSTLCDDCIEVAPFCDLVPRMGHEWNTATEEDVYDGYDG